MLYLYYWHVPNEIRFKTIRVNLTVVIKFFNIDNNLSNPFFKNKFQSYVYKNRRIFDFAERPANRLLIARRVW